MIHFVRQLVIICTLSIFGGAAVGQDGFATDPMDAVFVTEDIPRFWEAFDAFEMNGGNPFKTYLDKGSQGVQDFIPYRIESASKLRKTVKSRMADYEKIREGSFEVMKSTDKIREYYTNLKEMYPDAVFPPTYFVIGSFNSGGTSTDNGLIIGVEMQSDISNVPFIVAHELIHFNQHYSSSPNNLLSQSIMEGSADFIGELISGKHINEGAFNYGIEHEAELCAQFVDLMHDDDYHGWLYGTKGKKEDWPNDLGYWMGYQISSAYYDKASDKKKAISDILNIDDFEAFLDASGYLDAYLKKK